VHKDVGAIQLDARKIYDEITSERQRRHMTLAEMAAELNVGMSSIASWRCGHGMNADALMRVYLWLPIRDLRPYAWSPADAPAAKTEAA